MTHVYLIKSWDRGNDSRDEHPLHGIFTDFQLAKSAMLECAQKTVAEDDSSRENKRVEVHENSVRLFYTPRNPYIEPQYGCFWLEKIPVNKLRQSKYEKWEA